MAFVVDGRVGTKLTHEDTTANHLLRQRVPTDEGDYIYGRAQGDITTALWVTMLAGGTVRAMTGGNVIAGEQVMAAAGSVTSANFGWFHANGHNIRGLVSPDTTVRHMTDDTRLFYAIDSPAGNVWASSLKTFTTAGSLRRNWLPQLQMSGSGVGTSSSAIWQSVGDIYGVISAGTSIT